MQWDAIKERLAALDVSSLADTDKSMRVLDPEIRPLRTGLKLIGRARTVRCFDDFLTIIQAIYVGFTPQTGETRPVPGEMRALVDHFEATGQVLPLSDFPELARAAS